MLKALDKMPPLAKTLRLKGGDGIFSNTWAIVISDSR